MALRLAIFVRLVQDSINDNKAMVAKLNEKNVTMTWLHGANPSHEQRWDGSVGILRFVFDIKKLGVFMLSHG